MNKIAQQALNVALVQLDRVGFELAARGVTDKVNRHTLIAQFVVQQNRVRGEVDRANFMFNRTKKRAETVLSHVPLVGKLPFVKKRHK